MRILLIVEVLLFSLNINADIVHQSSTNSDGIANSLANWVYVGTPTPVDEVICGKFSDLPKVLPVYFSDRVELGRYVYKLAIHAGDISDEMTLETFVKGVSACHYSSEQVIAWANAISDNSEVTSNPLLELLVQNGFLVRPGKWYWPTFKYAHLVMVAHGKKRTLEQNIVHELLHVRYDTDTSLKSKVKEAWDRLSESQKKEFCNQIPSYNQLIEAQLIEEWGVRFAETQWFLPNESAKTISTYDIEFE